MNVRDEFPQGIRNQAEAELKQEYHRESVDRLKVILRTRALRYKRYRRFARLIKAAFGELFA